MTPSPSSGVTAQPPPDGGAVLDCLFNQGLSLLIELVDSGRGECVFEYAERNALARWLSTAPMVCTHTRDAVATSPAYAAVIFYERTRLGLDRHCTGGNYFFGGLPRSLPMFGAPLAMQFPVDRMRDLEWQDVLNERLHTVTKLDDFTRGSAKLVELANQFDHLVDLSAEVPRRVRIFISRTRSMCEGMRACKPAHWFRQCAHAQCNRLFMGRVCHADPAVEHSCHGHAEDKGYWSAIAPMPKYQENCKRFCSHACAAQWWDQLNSSLARTVDLSRHGSYLPHLHGQSTHELMQGAREPSPHAEYGFALKRNGQLRSAITKLHKKRKKWAPAVARIDIDREVRTRVLRANVDLGVLHATLKASCISRWHESNHFPGYLWDWRETGFISVAQRVRKIHDETNSGDLIDDLLKQHSFLNACRSRTRLVLQIA